jgi:hypothetical protein
MIISLTLKIRKDENEKINDDCRYLWNGNERIRPRG